MNMTSDRAWCVEMLLGDQWEQIDDDDGTMWHTRDDAHHTINGLILAGCISRMRVAHRGGWITVDHEVMGGVPCIRGTRVAVECITSLFPEPDEWIHECYPHVPLDAIRWLRANHKEEA